MARKALVIGGASSGSGKTTFAIGLMKALMKRGINVSPFKVGPDYIDPMFHRHVTGKHSYNLPAWMVDEETIKYLFEKRFEPDSFAVIEGVMGYYDGHKTDGFTGSTAAMAECLNVPAIIVFNASSMSLSAAAIVKGFKTFKENSMIEGVVLNNVASEMHYQMLKQGIENFTDVKCYGYLKKNEALVIGSRHLGLLQAEEISDLDAKVELISEQIEATVDLEGIINDFIYQTAEIDRETVSNLSQKLTALKNTINKKGGLNIGIAKDTAFSFYYDENIDTLNEIGINLVPFSPLYDSVVPSGLDGLYIGGGYPEVYADKLSQNKSFLNDLKTKLDVGMPCYAECGGLMYLTNEIVYDDHAYDMVGFFNAKSTMTKKLQRFGHINVEVDDFGPIKNIDLNFKAHEFHKSITENQEEIPHCYKISKGMRSWTCGYTKNYTVATYAHNHFYSNLSFLEYLLKLWGI